MEGRIFLIFALGQVSQVFAGLPTEGKGTRQASKQ
jgi:hypothetical protein